MMTPKILFFTAVLFVSAAVGYPANEIDWGKGRPGVRVVTNAPSRAEFDALVSGYSQYATWAANASNALRAVAITGPQSNVIASAGVHTNRTDNPHAVTAAQVGAPSIEALYTLMATSRIDKVWEGMNAWWTFESNTVVRHEETVYDGWVMDVPVALTNYLGNEVLAATENTAVSLPYPLETGFYSQFNVALPYVFYKDDYWFDVPVDSMDTRLELIPTEPGFSGIIYLTYNKKSTNSTVFVLDDTAETWSRGDMDSWTSTNQMTYTWVTNWMADGNAGRLWVTDLAASMANAVISNHANTPGLHLLAGDRAKIDGAVSAASAAGLVYSNAVSQMVVWTNAAGAVTNLAVCEHGVWSTNRFCGSELPDGVITNYATGGLYSEFDLYGQLPVPATTVVVIVENKTVYKVNVSTNIVLAFDMSLLNFTNMEVNFRLDLNIQNTNGFNIAFPVGWDFVPDLTVTGEYRFAVCATGPATMHVKQVYPTVYEWRACVGGPLNSNISQGDFSYYGYTGLIVSSGKPLYYNVSFPDPRSWYTVKIIFGTWESFSSLYISATAFAYGPNGGAKDRVWFSVTNSIAENTVSTRKFCFYNGFLNNKGEYYNKSLLQVHYSTGSDNSHLWIGGTEAKRMNELEISAYNAGWRP